MRLIRPQVGAFDHILSAASLRACTKVIAEATLVIGSYLGETQHQHAEPHRWVDHPEAARVLPD